MKLPGTMQQAVGHMNGKLRKTWDRALGSRESCTEMVTESEAWGEMAQLG